jgi:hypothetical protein
LHAKDFVRFFATDKKDSVNKDYWCRIEMSDCPPSSIVAWVADDSSIPFFSFYPVLSAQLIVNYSKDKLDVFVDLSFGDIELDATKEMTDTGVKWTFNKPMLPGQGFSVRIYEKKNVKPPKQKRKDRRSTENKLHDQRLIG